MDSDNLFLSGPRLGTVDKPSTPEGKNVDAGGPTPAREWMLRGKILSALDCKISPTPPKVNLTTLEYHNDNFGEIVITDTSPISPLG